MADLHTVSAPQDTQEARSTLQKSLTTRPPKAQPTDDADELYSQSSEEIAEGDTIDGPKQSDGAGSP